MHEYAAAAAVMTNFAQKASIQSKSKLNARLQKQKGQVLQLLLVTPHFHPCVHAVMITC